jgi:hypothetical protein
LGRPLEAAGNVVIGITKIDEVDDNVAARFDTISSIAIFTLGIERWRRSADVGGESCGTALGGGCGARAAGDDMAALISGQKKKKRRGSRTGEQR